jgi:chitinase
MTNDATWISYDNEKSVQAKTNFAMSQKMAGVLIWSLDTDDFKGLCGSQKFPLLKSIISAITDYFKPATGTICCWCRGSKTIDF